MEKQELTDLVEYIQKQKAKIAIKISELQREQTNLNVEEKEAKRKLWAMDKSGGFEITDHALLRYLQRIEKQDHTQAIKNIEDQIFKEIGEGVREGAYISDGKYECKDFYVQIIERKVVTLIAK